MEFPGLEHHETAIRDKLKEVIGPSKGQLYTMMRYHMGWEDQMGRPTGQDEGKRVRPLLALLACESLGGEGQQALPAAAALELVHNFSLVHDDIQDGSPNRRGRPTVWWLWGPSQAINAGDAFYALARLAIFQLQDAGVPYQKVLRAAQMMDQAAFQLCEGQYLDIQFQSELSVKMESYLKMVEGKTGALFQCALQCGALVASDDEAKLRAFGEAGRRLGFAFQIRNDWLDLWESEKEERGSDLRSRKKSFPIVYALQQAQGKRKTELVSFLQRFRLDDAAVNDMIALLEQLEVKEHSLEVIQQYQREALSCLDEAGIASPAVERLKKFMEYVVQQTT
jgi:geranylgeranyl diphosphate synthase type I